MFIRTILIVGMSLFLATDLWAAMFVCPKDESQFVQKKREMVQKFKNCQKAYSVNTVSVSAGVPGLSVKVWEGESGVESDEKYVDIYDEVIDDGLELAQLVYFEESNELLAYLLDEENNGYWKEFDSLTKENQEKIKNLSIWE